MVENQNVYIRRKGFVLKIGIAKNKRKVNYLIFQSFLTLSAINQSHLTADYVFNGNDLFDKFKVKENYYQECDIFHLSSSV